jgi:hypothetical protein
MMIYIPSGKGAERAIFEALTVFAASRLQVQIGFYTHIGSVDLVRNTVATLTGMLPPSSANGPAKVVDRTDFAARMAAGSNTETGPWAGVFLPVKGFTMGMACLLRQPGQLDRYGLLTLSAKHKLLLQLREWTYFLATQCKRLAYF